MHFRFRGNSIQVVKSQIDPATGKAKSIPLGSINRTNLAVSGKLLANCSPQELKEIEAWVERYRGVAELKSKVAALTLPEQIGVAMMWFSNANIEEAREPAEELIASLSMLRRQLHKRGLV